MSKSDSDQVLQVSEITKIYGRAFLSSIAGKTLSRRVTGAEDVSFLVKKGEIFGFLGPNGAGKTTTIRCILDYLKMQSGKITIFGLDHHLDALKIRKRIGYIPGDLALFKNFTGNELIDFYSAFRPVDPIFLKELRSMFRVEFSVKIKTR